MTTLIPDRSPSSYYRQVRQAERTILAGAYQALNGDDQAIAAALGLHVRWIRDRMTVLGGCRPGEPINEPPLASNYATKQDGIPPKPRTRLPGQRGPGRPRKIVAKPGHIDSPAPLETSGADSPSDSGG